MRKKLLILIMAVAFAAASLVPATASAAALKFCIEHKGVHEIVISFSALQAHLDHGDDPESVVPADQCP